MKGPGSLQAATASISPSQDRILALVRHMLPVAHVLLDNMAAQGLKRTQEWPRSPLRFLAAIVDCLAQSRNVEC